ncbi:MAG: PQQ-binding-like beta-propeller repeat protein [Planctomycetota bacterium]
MPKPKSCRPWNQYKQQFDVSCEPAVKAKRLFVPSMVRDSVTAYDTDTGRENWRFYAGAPVRFAPVAWNDKVIFGSDDGYLYCLDAGDAARRRKANPVRQQ